MLIVSELLREKVIHRIMVTQTKTVAELLDELGFSKDHIVFVDGKRATLESLLHENDSVVVLPLIAGG